MRYYYSGRLPELRKINMRTLGNLLVIFLVIVGLLCLLPLVTFGFGLLTAVAVFAIWILPFWIIATSDQTTGFEKIAWLLAMILLSWFAWIFYFFLAPIKPRRRFDHHDRFTKYDRYDYRY